MIKENPYFHFFKKPNLELTEFSARESKKPDFAPKSAADEKRIEDTRKNFAGTNIIETLDGFKNISISYDLNSLIIYPDSSKSITISKENGCFKLNYLDNSSDNGEDTFEVSSTTSNKIIDGVLGLLE